MIVVVIATFVCITILVIVFMLTRPKTVQQPSPAVSSTIQQTSSAAPSSPSPSPSPSPSDGASASALRSLAGIGTDSSQSFVLKSVASGKCLTSQGGDQATPLQHLPCDGRANQKFKILSVSDTYKHKNVTDVGTVYQIQSATEKPMCMFMRYDSDPRKGPSMVSCNTEWWDQHFYFKPRGGNAPDSHFMLYSGYPNTDNALRCIESDASETDPRNVACSRSETNQAFYIEKAW